MTRDGRRWTWQAIEEVSGQVKVTTYDDLTFQPLVIASSEGVERFTYDVLGRMARREREGEVTEFSYGPIGKIVRAVRSSGSGASSEVGYEYDAHGRLLVADSREGRARFQYDDRGRLAVLVTKNGIAERRVAIGYNEHDRPVRLEVEGVGATEVRYGAGGNVRRPEAAEERRVFGEATAAFVTLQELLDAASTRPKLR